MFISDLRARCLTADRVRIRLLEFVEKRGVDFVVGSLRKMSDTAEAGSKKKDKDPARWQIPGVVFNDAIGWSPSLVRSCFLTLIKDGGLLFFRLHRHLAGKSLFL